ncbi:methionyl-tRNA formyltransferase [mine drainage metagenome]|uniref:methionyl-tRNA formyltransferase n=1 Tax=mine drainage metagenome TaxID=410659 RepID=A0A1J5RQ26_9ZZZZ
MRIVFAGTPEFAAVALEAILAAGHDVPLVLTQPDRPAGRGMKLAASAVKQLALQHGLPVYQPERLRDPASHEPIRAADAELMVVAAYGLILPQAVLALPRLGCINIHASLLPRWRGAAPIQRAILAGDRDTGITLMQMDAGLDTGAMLLQRSLAIEPTDTAATLHDKLAALGAQLIVEALTRPAQLIPVPQPTEGVCYAAKIAKAEAALDWRRPAAELERQVRAFDPFPVATAAIRETPLKIWRAVTTARSGGPGEVLAAGDSGIVVACGQDALCLTELQKPGSRRLTAGEFLRGFALNPGEVFSKPD